MTSKLKVDLHYSAILPQHHYTLEGIHTHTQEEQQAVENYAKEVGGRRQIQLDEAKKEMKTQLSASWKEGEER